MGSGGHAIAVAGAEDLGDLLPLMRAYCDFPYEVDPSDAALVEMAWALIGDLAREGVQLIARDEEGAVVGPDRVLAVVDAQRLPGRPHERSLRRAGRARQRPGGHADRGVPRPLRRARRDDAHLADREGQPAGAGRLRPHRRRAVGVGRLRARGTRSARRRYPAAMPYSLHLLWDLEQPGATGSVDDLERRARRGSRASPASTA